MFGSMTGSLSAADVRALLRLVGEVRSLGDQPQAWRSHLANELGRLCNARAVVTSELQPRTPKRRAEQAAVQAGSCEAAARPVVVADAGIEQAARESFYSQVIWYDHSTDDTLNALLPLYGHSFVRSRAELSRDADWYGSALANEAFRSQNCDDFILSMCAVPQAGAISSLELFRPWRDTAFGERERLLVQLLHEELAADFHAVERAAPRLSPRLKEVFALLSRGLSEKQVAAELDVSQHTVHDYVKALYRAYQVGTRGELLAEASRAPRGRAALASLGS
jgi:DNA-binding CsgD family transcriptional regulator